MSNDKPPIRIESICIIHKEDSLQISPETSEIGIFVEAEVSYPITVFKISDQKYKEHRRVETLRSEGIWGVAYDSGFAEQVTWEKEQLENLKNHLSIFGVDVSNFHEIRVQMRCE